MHYIEDSQNVIYMHFLRTFKKEIQNALMSDLNCLNTHLTKLFYNLENNDINLFIKSKRNANTNSEYIIFRLKLKKIFTIFSNYISKKTNINNILEEEVNEIFKYDINLNDLKNEESKILILYTIEILKKCLLHKSIEIIEENIYFVYNWFAGMLVGINIKNVVPMQKLEKDYMPESYSIYEEFNYAKFLYEVLM